MAKEFCRGIGARQEQCGAGGKGSGKETVALVQVKVPELQLGVGRRNLALIHSNEREDFWELG